MEISFKMKRIIFLLIVLFSTPVFASDGSIIYNVYSIIFDIIKNFSLNMHEGIILIYSRSYFLICAIASPIVLYAYARNKIDFDALIAYFIFLMISVALVVNNPNNIIAINNFKVFFFIYSTSFSFKVPSSLYRD